MSEGIDTNWSVGKGYSRIMQRESDCGAWLEGTVLTATGIVGCYSEDRFSRVEIVFNGTCYSRRWDRSFSKRGLCRMAKQFAADIKAESA